MFDDVRICFRGKMHSQKAFLNKDRQTNSTRRAKVNPVTCRISEGKQ